MAEAFFNHAAKTRGLPHSAQSAGTMGGKELNPRAVEVMEELGISMTGHEPKILDQRMADTADRVISMGCGVDATACPAKFLVTEDWELEDPAGKSIEKVRIIRDQIQMRINQLLGELDK